MATKPELRRAVANSYIKASDYNYNFDQLNNYIENGIADNAINNYEVDREYSKGQWVLANTINGKGLYESQVDGNKGNSLLDTTYWKKASGSIAVTYADDTTADLEKIVYQTKQNYEGRETFPNTQMDVVEDMGDIPLYFANAKTISASTNYTYTLNGTFCADTSKVAMVTITKNGNSVIVHGNVVRIPANCTFTSNFSGKFYFDDNYYGYLAT